MAVAERSLIPNAIQSESHPLQGSANDYDPLLKLIQDARFCLLGEATHGTHEFYRERAGVIYLPETERQSHYFEARMVDQFDVVIHFDETRALEPLERYALWESGEPPETYPTGV